MSQATLFTRSGAPMRKERFRLFAGSTLAAGVLLLGAACGGGDDPAGTNNPAGDGGGDNAAIKELKVCSLVDFSGFQQAIGIQGFAAEPQDVRPGNGIDPGGPQCVAQVDLPEVQANENAEPRDLPNAILNLAVLPFLSTEEAAAEYESRVANAEQGAEALHGDYDRGVVYTNPSAENVTYAVVQKGAMLVKVQFTSRSDEDYEMKLPFTLEDARNAVGTLAGELIAAAQTEIGG